MHECSYVYIGLVTVTCTSCGDTRLASVPNESSTWFSLDDPIFDF